MAPRTFFAISAVLAFPAFAGAQTAPAPMSATQLTLACAPPAALAERRRPALHVAGAQDTVARSVFDDHDLLVVSGGTSAGLSVGQQFFLRRPILAPYYAGRLRARHPIHTAGWIRIVATNDNSSIALLEHACGAIHAGDYLEPFVMPAVPGDLRPADDPAGLDFGSMGRVMFGQDEQSIVSPGGFLLIDRGAGQGADTGARFAIYRDVKEFVPQAGGMRSAHLPLAAVGEGVVVASGPSIAVVQLMKARDAVQAGDFVVPRRR